MKNKIGIVRAMHSLFSDGQLGFKHLAGLVSKNEWFEPGSNDFPNYKFIYTLCKDYLVYAKTLEIPAMESMVYENLLKYLASLARHDPAYYTRFNGVMFRILHDYTNGKISDEPGGNYEYLKFIVNWWDLFDGRERNHEVYRKFLDYIVARYYDTGFYTKSIDWTLDWIGKHMAMFVYSDDMNPKKWYGNCGFGMIDNITLGGSG